MKKSIILLLTVFTVTSSLTFAHRGRTDSKGCHTNRKTGEYHCHRKKKWNLKQYLTIYKLL